MSSLNIWAKISCVLVCAVLHPPPPPIFLNLFSNVQWRRCLRNGTASGKSPRSSPFISVFQVQEIKLQICRVRFLSSCWLSSLHLSFSQPYLVWMLPSDSFISLSFFILSFFASPFFLFTYLYSIYSICKCPMITFAPVYFTPLNSSFSFLQYSQMFSYTRTIPEGFYFLLFTHTISNRFALIWNWTCRFSLKILFPFPPIPAKLKRDYFDNRQSDAKMFLSAILRQYIGASNSFLE